MSPVLSPEDQVSRSAISLENALIDVTRAICDADDLFEDSKRVVVMNHQIFQKTDSDTEQLSEELGENLREMRGLNKRFAAFTRFDDAMEKLRDKRAAFSESLGHVDPELRQAGRMISADLFNTAATLRDFREHLDNVEESTYDFAKKTDILHANILLNMDVSDETCPAAEIKETEESAERDTNNMLESRDILQNHLVALPDPEPLVAHLDTVMGRLENFAKTAMSFKPDQLTSPTGKLPQTSPVKRHPSRQP